MGLRIALYNSNLFSIDSCDLLSSSVIIVRIDYFCGIYRTRHILRHTARYMPVARIFAADILKQNTELYARVCHARTLIYSRYSGAATFNSNDNNDVQLRTKGAATQSD